MGTWDIGPFGNDTAADFANARDDAGSEACEALIRGVLVRTVVATGFLREADEVVAAAALVAAQCPGGQAVVDTPYGPETPMPVFPSGPRALADEALARISSDKAGAADLEVGRPGGLEAVAGPSHAPSRSACRASPFHHSLRRPVITKLTPHGS
ncbi:DUF4259 domain-containing protein [Streptomyces sp. NBC_01176]|uniref:DUF4259 domain-containing protein n=1 Tax=Streptomyces sp. NBC_01176 TaxID=2903760 RepID=UPI00386C5F8E